MTPENCIEPKAENPKIKVSASEPHSRKLLNLTHRLVSGLFRSIWFFAKKAVMILSIPLLVILILVGLEKAAEMGLKKTVFATVYSDDLHMAKRDLSHPVSHYDYDLTPGVCLIHNQVKGNRYEYANNAGFRDPRPITLEKPADEFRIFLTGGSTAFGLGASGQAAPLTNFYYLEQRETISHVLEKILNVTAPVQGKQIRVYNTAVWGYSYQHLLFRYIAKIRDYKPDLIVSLDGVNELLPLSSPSKDWNYFREGQYNEILRQIFQYSGPGLASYLTLWLKNNTFLMTLLWNGADPFITMATGERMRKNSVPGQSWSEPGPNYSQDERSKAISDRVAAVIKTIEDYHSLLQNDGVPHVFALQPLLYLSNKPRHEWEKKVESLEEHSQYYDISSANLYKFLIEKVSKSASEKIYFVADFSHYFDDTSEWVFTDWCHLTAGANYLLAKELANIIKERFLRVTLDRSG